MTRSLRFKNYRNLHPSQNTEIFDLTKLKDYPLRLLYIENNEKNKKTLFYQDVTLNEFFSNEKTNSVKYVLIGDTNRTNLSSDYIVETVSDYIMPSRNILLVLYAKEVILWNITSLLLVKYMI